MRRIEVAFERLGVIAFQELLGHDLVLGRHLGEAELGARRRLGLSAPVGPDHAVRLEAAIRLGAHLGADVAIAGHVRRLEAAAVGVELPAVIDAAQAAVFVAREIERRAAMRAVRAEQADLALRVAEGDQILAEQAHAKRRPVALGEFGGQQRRLPVLAQQVAHRRAGPDARQ